MCAWKTQPLIPEVHRLTQVNLTIAVRISLSYKVFGMAIRICPLRAGA